jgi:hypothetical protein
MILNFPCRADCNAAVCECRVLAQNLKVFIEAFKRPGAAEALARMIEDEATLALQFDDEGGDDDKGGGNSVH